VALLSQLLSPPVIQSHSGITLYPVEDRGMTPAPGVRRSWTNVSQPFHTDGPWVRRPPAVVALHCLRSAREGGMSQCISIRTLFQHLAEESAAMAERLEQDFYWHRQGEHAAEEAPTSRLPMVWRDDAGRWCARLYSDYVLSGYRAAGVALDEPGRAVLEGAARLAQDRQRRLEFMLRSGEIEWVNNRWCAHARSEFEPRDKAQRPRMLVRVWHRLDESSVALDG
jgi:alpha-ketoglutarate-dependent taurine dioxygenase